MIKCVTLISLRNKNNIIRIIIGKDSFLHKKLIHSFNDIIFDDVLVLLVEASTKPIRARG